MIAVSHPSAAAPARLRASVKAGGVERVTAEFGRVDAQAYFRRAGFQ